MMSKTELLVRCLIVFIFAALIIAGVIDKIDRNLAEQSLVEKCSTLTELEAK